MTGSRRPLRIGLLLDDRRVPAWVHRVLRDLQASPHGRIALLVLNRPEGTDAGLRRLWRRRRSLVHALHARLDRRLFAVRPDPFERLSVDPILGGVPVIEVTPRQTTWSDRFPEDVLEEIRSHDLDVALRFGFRILRGGALEIARHGVWSYHHGDNRVIRGGPPGFWEVMEGHPVTGSVLQVLSEELDAGRVIYRSWSSTNRRSVNRNKAQVYWKSAAFVERCLAALAETGDPATGTARGEAEELRPYADRLYRKPDNLQAARLLTRHALRAGGAKLRRTATRKQWFPAFRIDPRADHTAPELFRFTPVLPPPDRLWADPFPVPHGNGWLLFVEEVVGRRGRGRIAALEISPDGRWSPPVPVLEQTHHLSYPFVFRWRDHTYMMPESAAARRVEVYRAVRFPGEWTAEATFLEGLRAVDPTLHEQDGTWWLFANLAGEETPDAHDELHLFHGPSPLGPWRPHRHNPVVSDARRARPAGRLFWWQGDLYRPAQDCSRRYGHAVTLQRVLRLDEDDFREETVSRIPPRWYPGLIATHTFNRCPGLTVVDGQRRIVRMPWA